MLHKKIVRRMLLLGAVCLLLLGGSTWYAVRFNGSRLVVPMDFSTYVFRPQDLPMILSMLLLILYVLCLAGLLVRWAFAEKRRQAGSPVTRTINPKLGFLGFLGFLGLGGFWTYGVDGSIFPFLFFTFFGFFGFFYEGKLSNTLMDERYLENRRRARATADRTALTIIFLSALALSQGRLWGGGDTMLIAHIILVSLAMGLDVFLGEFLLYRYDHDDPVEEGDA